MAVTAIWHVSSRIGKALDYVMNPEKTVEKPENSPDAIAARKAVGDVLDYAENSDKTEKMMYPFLFYYYNMLCDNDSGNDPG